MTAPSSPSAPSGPSRPGERFSARRVLIALAGIFGVVLALGLRYYGHYHPFADLVPGAARLGPPPASLRVTEAVVTGRAQGRIRWRIKARSITLSRDRSQVTVQGIHDGLLLSPAGQASFALKAGQAVYQKPFGISLLDTPGNAIGGFLTVGGGITGHALQPGGPILTSDTLTWDIARSEVRSLGRTEARFPPGAHAIGGMTMQATVLVWDTQAGTLSAPGVVTAVFADRESRVQGDDVSVDTRQGTLTLHHLHGTFRIPPTLN